MILYMCKMSPLKESGWTIHRILHIIFTISVSLQLFPNETFKKIGNTAQTEFWGKFIGLNATIRGEKIQNHLS